MPRIIIIDGIERNKVVNVVYGELQHVIDSGFHAEINDTAQIDQILVNDVWIDPAVDA